MTCACDLWNVTCQKDLCKNKNKKTGIIKSGIDCIDMVQYHANVSWQSLEARTSRLDPRSSKLESFEYRGSSRVHRVSRQGNKELFAWLVFHTSYPRAQWVRFLFTGTTCISAEMRFCWSDVRTCMLELERVRSQSVLLVPCRLQPKVLCVFNQGNVVFEVLIRKIEGQSSIIMCSVLLSEAKSDRACFHSQLVK